MDSLQVNSQSSVARSSVIESLRSSSGLLTDLYELTMAAGYVQTHFEARATFELFARHLPARRNYLVAAGLEQAIEFLENVRFSTEEIDFLRSNRIFRNIRPEFFSYLSKFRFTGDVWAVPEGTIAFPGEPLLRVTAPIVEAQILETYLLATLSYQTMIASKAARVCTAAQGRDVVDFGARRGHGAESSLPAARAAVIGGCAGTSNVLAGLRFGLAIYGTQAHSWVMAHDRESDAFAHFLDAFPDNSTLLLDTYDVRQALKQILAMGRRPAGVRLDSGDVAKDSRWVRRELNRAGWQDVKIFASGDLDEYRIRELLARHAAIDAFGVGTALATPGDAPHLNMIYKLVEVERDEKIWEAAKLTRAKATYPGRKQVFRHSNAAGEFRFDRVALENEPSQGAEPLLVPVMRAGKRVDRADSIEDARKRCRTGLARLPKSCRQISQAAVYPVRYSKALRDLLANVRERVRRSALK
ncbi:MAG TPA: nicotinate phosphoribosyltransferase [Candidatus Acidoferrales bacterium]|nr:nicotinate phosphoribosyltransferase [Candidatus Acidoferrales bacterium]